MGRISILLVALAAIGLTHFSDAQPSEHREKRGAPSTNLPRWKLPVPYLIPVTFNATQKAIIETAIGSIMENTCIKFSEDKSDNAKLVYDLNNNGICSSITGDSRMGWGLPAVNHLVNLDTDCVVLGRIQHETAHALGLQHTQTRHDRDEYLIVDTENIRVNKTKNFEKIAVENSPTYGVPFEFGSRMMYPPYDYNIRPTRVLTTRDELYQSSLGTAPVLTFYDFKLLNAHYNCMDDCTNTITCQNGGYQNPHDCSRCLCGDFHDGQYCEIERGVITLSENMPEVLTFKTIAVEELVDEPAFDWANFNLDPLRVIKAPKNRRIRVTIEKQHAYGTRPGHFEQYITPCPERICNFFGVEIADKDLAFTGKKFCCSENEEKNSFVSKSDVIGYRAYAHRGYAFNSTVTFHLEPETDVPSTAASITQNPTEAQETTVPTTTVDSRTTIYDTDTNQCEY